MSLPSNFANATVAQVACAPDRPPFQHMTRLFLGGTTPAKSDDDDSDSSKPVVDWRKAIRAAVSDLPVTVVDPLRPDWDSYRPSHCRLSTGPREARQWPDGVRPSWHLAG
jgi:hypothetical protein